MREPRCIRYFSSHEKAKMARELLVSEGFEAEVNEQTIGSVTIDKYGYPLKFKLYVEKNDIKKIARILAERLRTKK